MSENQKIWLYDTTLRDGAQREGISLSVSDKIKIVQTLDRMGIPFIEGGWPGANPKDVQFFWQVQEISLQQAQVVAFCSTRRPHKPVETDKMLQAILNANTQWITLFGKSWDLHVTDSLKTTLEENLLMIEETIAYLISHQRQVIYDAEHWFDGYMANPDYALATLKAAIKGGAKWLVLCDTNGGMLPHQVSSIVAEVKSHLKSELAQNQVKLGIHTHNDSGTAVANAIAGVIDGVEMVQGTMNGYGERCGNANLCTLIPNLQLKLGYDCLSKPQLTQLTSNSRLISELVNLAPDDHAPFVGRSAFAHKGGIHVSAVTRNPITYEHIEPKVIGNERRIVVSEQSGLSNVIAKAKSLGINLSKKDPICQQLVRKLKQLEHEGYQFEAADASFKLLMLSAFKQRAKLFTIKRFQVHSDIVLTDAFFDSNVLATIKIVVGEEELLEIAQGNGPVSALDKALRKALVQFYPEIAEFQLTDYKVRILDSKQGTQAKTRVLVESSNGEQRWRTVGVSCNILDASYQAVIEGIEYGILLITGREQSSNSLACPLEKLKDKGEKIFI